MIIYFKTPAYPYFYMIFVLFWNLRWSCITRQHDICKKNFEMLKKKSLPFNLDKYHLNKFIKNSLW